MCVDIERLNRVLDLFNMPLINEENNKSSILNRLGEKVTVTCEYNGVYVDIEDINKSFFCPGPQTLVSILITEAAVSMDKDKIDKLFG